MLRTVEERQWPRGGAEHQLASAADHVFNIPELLESVLLYLGVKDLLLCQRTCRGFRATVDGSVRLRRKLFFEPDWKLQGRLLNACAPNASRGHRPDNNNLLLRAFPGCYPTVRLVVPAETERETAEPSPVTNRTWEVYISFNAGGQRPLSPAVAYPNASWRKMYLSNPPCQTLYLARRWQRSQLPAMVRECGIFMGDFFDEVTRNAPGCNDRRWHESYISSDDDWHFEGTIGPNSADK